MSTNYLSKTSNKISLRLYYLVILLIPFDEQIAFNGFSLIKFIGILLFFLTLLEYKLYYATLPKVFFYFFIYISIGVSVDIFRQPFSAQSLNQIISPLLFFILMIITYRFVIWGKIKPIILTIVSSSLVLTGFSFFERGDLSDEGRLLSVLSNDANFTATYISLNILFCFLVLIKAIKLHPKYRYLTIFILFISILSIILSGSRGAMISIVLSIISLLFITTERSGKLKYLFYILLFLAFGYYLVAQNQSVLIRIFNSINKGDTAGRDFIWLQSLFLIENMPFFGYGYNTYLQDLGHATGKLLRVTHNTYLAAILSSGWVGFSFFLLFLYKAFKAVWAIRKIEYGNYLFLVFILLSLSSMSINMEITKWYWIILALCLGAKSYFNDIERIND